MTGSGNRGRLVGKQRDTNGSTFVAGVVNIEALLRHHRESAPTMCGARPQVDQQCARPAQ